MKHILTAIFCFFAYCSAAELPKIELTQEQIQRWVKAKEECGEVSSEDCKKAFFLILNDEQRRFLAINQQYEKDGNKKSASDKDSKVKLSMAQFLSWEEIEKTCGDEHGETCKREFFNLLTDKQKTALGLTKSGDAK